MGAECQIFFQSFSNFFRRKPLVFCARACYNGFIMNTKAILGLILSAALVLTGAGAAMPSLTAQGDEGVTQIGKENSELFLPESFEQYLPLTAPSDVAFCEKYIAVADGTKLYVYDRMDGTYSRYEHSVIISKIQFSQENKLYFSDRNAAFYTFDTEEMTASLTAIPAATFHIEGTTLYTAAVVSGTTTLYAVSLNVSLDTPPTSSFGTIALNSTPRMTVANETLYCATDNIVNSYNLSSLTFARSFLLSEQAPVNSLSSVCAYGNSLYYTVSGAGEQTINGLYRADFEGDSKLLAEDDGYTALTVYRGELYAIRGTSVVKTDVSGDTLTFTDYEICSSSSSVNRLASGIQTARAGNLLVVSDEGNKRVTVYDMATASYSVISCEYVPDLVATDGNIISVTDGAKQIYTYRADGSLISEQCYTTLTPIAGIACVFGECYYVTGFNYYGCAREGTAAIDRTTTISVNASGLTADIYGNLYVCHTDGSVYCYAENAFTDNQANGEKLSYTIPADSDVIRADFEGNVYSLSDDKIYRNGELYASVNAEGCVYRDDTPVLRSFALGFEDGTVFLLYDNFILKTDAISFPTLRTIQTQGAKDEIFTAQPQLKLVTVAAGSVTVRTDLDLLSSDESGYFPYSGYSRTTESARGILLAETDEYCVVALFGSDHKYTANLVRSDRCTPVDESEYWQEAEGTRYLTSDASVYLYPCLVNALRGETLTRATRVQLEGIVTSGDTSDYPYALVSFEQNGETQYGYIPLSYLTAIPPAVTDDEFRFAHLAEGVSVEFTAEDGTTITLTGGAQVEIIEESAENGITARVLQDGKYYYATLAAEDLQTPSTDMMRISLIIILCVLGALILADYLLLRPKKRA